MWIRADIRARQALPGHQLAVPVNESAFVVAGVVIVGFLAFFGALFLGSLLSTRVRLRVFEKGLSYRQGFRTRFIQWAEVREFYLHYKEVRRGRRRADYYFWVLSLYDGDRVEFHKTIFPRSRFQETMELIDEVFKDYRDRLEERRYGLR